MPSRNGSLTIDGARCSPSLWSRFDSERTTRAHGRKLLREVILDNFVSFTLPAPWTHRDLVEQIAKRSQQPIPIESLPPELSRPVNDARGFTAFGFPGDHFDQVALNYEHLQWWVSERGLNMAILSEHTGLSAFDQVAGRLMVEALQRSSSGRIPPAEYTKIAAALDKAAFKLRDCLERACGKRLREWNQHHPNQAVHTFSKAAAVRLPWLHRGIKKRLYRAAEKFRRLSP